MENTELVQIAMRNGNFVLVNPSSIASIEQLDVNTVRITMKEIKDGQSISYDCNYSLDTLINADYGIFRKYKTV